MNQIVAAGIVTYNPDMKRLQKNIEAICGQVGKVYIFDNCSNNIAELFELVNHLKQLNSNIVFIQNKYNAGIAFALNFIMERAELDLFEWVLTLDQDSVAPENIITIFTNYLDQQVGIISPCIQDMNNFKSHISCPNIMEVNQVITSGSLTNVGAWRVIRGFDNKMFIDGVDFDFCNRLRSHGYRILKINTVILYHEIGHITKRKFLCFDVTVKNHNSFRKYYIAKNLVYLDKKNYCQTFPVTTIMREIKLLLVTLLYENDKKKKLKAIIRGMVDGFKEDIAR